MRVPPLETERLLIRELTLADLEAVHDMLDVQLTSAGATLEERERWLQWTVLGYAQLAALNQPPYGDRAIVLKASGKIIGACGFVPCLAPFHQLPGFDAASVNSRYTPQVGLYWAVSPDHQRQGYATEAARALVEYAFGVLHLQRLVAMTTRANAASIRVMRKLGMRLVRNPEPDPDWLQVVGILDAGDCVRPSPASVIAP